MITGLINIPCCTSVKDAQISSLCCSPDGCHLAVGLTTGEVKVFEVSDGFKTISPIFVLDKSTVSNSYSRTAAHVIYTYDMVEYFKCRIPHQQSLQLPTQIIESCLLLDTRMDCYSCGKVYQAIAKYNYDL